MEDCTTRMPVDSNAKQQETSVSVGHPANDHCYTASQDEGDSGVETVCTADGHLRSRRSGHQSSEKLMRKRKKGEKRRDGPHSASPSPRCIPVVSRGRPIRVDDVLWFICFGTTMMVFKVPYVLLFNPKVDWHYLRLAVLLQLNVCVMAIAFRIFVGFTRERATLLRRVSILLRLFSCISTLGVATLFCLATWRVFEVWALYIAAVSSMAYVASISII